MSDRSHYPPGLCVACDKPTDRMPLCDDHRYVWESDGDTWMAKDSESQRIRELAAAFQRGFDREWAKLPARPSLDPRPV